MEKEQFKSAQPAVTPQSTQLAIYKLPEKLNSGELYEKSLISGRMKRAGKLHARARASAANFMSGLPKTNSVRARFEPGACATTSSS